MMKKTLPPRGSIMIWTLLLGVTLATVFLFFSQSLNANTLSQQQTMEYLNAKVLVDSYADYVEQLGSAALGDLKANGISFNRITGSITNDTGEITGVLDAGDDITYAMSTGGSGDKIQVEWDRCGADDTEFLEITDGPGMVDVISENNCSGPASPGVIKYNEIKQFGNTTSFTLTAPAAPTDYRITTVGDAKLFDNYWHLELEMPLGFRKKIKISRDFVAS